MPDVVNADLGKTPARTRKAVTVFITGVIAGGLSGAALGVLWLSFAPRVSVVVTPDRVVPEGFQPQEYFAANIAFGALGALAGVFMAIALVSMRREHLLASLAAALASSAVGTWTMWWVGSNLGTVDLENVEIPDSTVLDGPLEVTLPAMVLMWPLGSSVVIAIMAFGDFLTERKHSRSHSA